MSVFLPRNKLRYIDIENIHSQIDYFFTNDHNELSINKEDLDQIIKDIRVKGMFYFLDYDFLPLCFSNNFVLEDDIFLRILDRCGDTIATMHFDLLLTKSNVGVLKLFEEYIKSKSSLPHDDVKELEYIYEYARYFLMKISA